MFDEELQRYIDTTDNNNLVVMGDINQRVGEKPNEGKDG